MVFVSGPEEGKISLSMGISLGTFAIVFFVELSLSGMVDFVKCTRVCGEEAVAKCFNGSSLFSYN